MNSFLGDSFRSKAFYCRVKLSTQWSGQMFLFALNTLLLLGIFFAIDFPFRSLKVLIGGLIAFCIVGAILQFVKKRPTRLALLQPWLFSSLLTVYAIEAVVALFPNIVPSNARIFLEPSADVITRLTKIRRLDENPYNLFKPNEIIRAPGDYGDASQFEYEWKTDGLGFKNPPGAEQIPEYLIVAAGDSFTEGLGVATNEAWTNLLTLSGYPTYNIGVQGYAPTQVFGAITKFAGRFNPKFIFFGYYALTFDREGSFDETGKVDLRAGHGINDTSIQEVTHRTRWFILATYLLARNLPLNIQFGGINLPDVADKKLVNHYVAEINAIRYQSAHTKWLLTPGRKVGPPPNFGQTLKQFERIAKYSRSIGAVPVLLYFPQRGNVYWNRATGHPVDEMNGGVLEAREFNRFSRGIGLDFIDFTPTLVEYVNKLPSNYELDDLPYLQIDGHLSPRGHELVKARLIEYLKLREDSRS